MLKNESSPRHRRPDAERNRGKILTAARQAFNGRETDVSMAEIARRAGVGMATLYRNFPGRRELLEAVFMEEVDEICEAASTTTGDAPSTRLQEWLRLLFAFLSGKGQITSELLKHTGSGDPVFGANRDRVLAAGHPLLRSAQREGDVRGDIDVEQIVDMIHAVAMIEGDRAHVQPILQAALDGLRNRRTLEEPRGDGRTRHAQRSGP